MWKFFRVVSKPVRFFAAPHFPSLRLVILPRGLTRKPPNMENTRVSLLKLRKSEPLSCLAHSPQITAAG